MSMDVFLRCLLDQGDPRLEATWTFSLEAQSAKGGGVCMKAFYVAYFVMYQSRLINAGFYYKAVWVTSGLSLN